MDARTHFLQSLEQYASDGDENETKEVGSEMNGKEQSPPSASAHCAPSSIHSLFGPHDDEQADHSTQKAGVAHSSGPHRVGMSLLRAMQRYPSSPSSASLEASSGAFKRGRAAGPLEEEEKSASEALATVVSEVAPATQAGRSNHSNRFAIVKAYKPLSYGGFMDSSDGAADLTRCLAVGATVVRRPHPAAESHTPQSSAGLSPITPASSPATPRGTHSFPPSAGSPTATSIAYVPPDPKALLSKRFKAESQMSEEERTFGRQLDPQLWASLGEVTRCDSARRVVEVAFLNGDRSKCSVADLRPAGVVEQQLFQRWKADPSSRPVHRIAGSAVPVPLGSSVSGTSSDHPCRSAVWWVLPNLVVRVVAESAGEAWWGHKAVVQSVQRRTATMRLARLVETSGVRRPPAVDVVEVTGLDSVETVVPRRGQVGMLVLGDRRGELVQVVRRQRTASTVQGGEGGGPDLEVIVAPAAGPDGKPAGEEFQVSPDQICLLATKK